MPYANKTKQKDYHKEYYLKNRDRLLVNAKENYKGNSVQKRECVKRYYEEHKLEEKPKRAAYARKWQKENAGRVNFNTAERRARIKKSIDETANIEEMRKFYLLAESISLDTGTQYVVDHIKPIVLGGKHHQDNLQVITALDNSRKGARYPFEVVNRYFPNVFFNPSPDQQSTVA